MQRMLQNTDRILLFCSCTMWIREQLVYNSSSQNVQWRDVNNSWTQTCSWSVSSHTLWAWDLPQMHVSRSQHCVANETLLWTQWCTGASNCSRVLFWSLLGPCRKYVVQYRERKKIETLALVLHGFILFMHKDNLSGSITTPSELPCCLLPADFFHWAYRNASFDLLLCEVYMQCCLKIVQKRIS